MTDAHCLYCGKPLDFTRKGGRVYVQKYCDVRCRKQAYKRRMKTNPQPRPLPTPEASPETVDIQTYSQAQIIAYLETSPLPSNIKLDIWADWKAGQIPREPPRKHDEEVMDDDPLPEHEQVEAVRAVAITLTRLHAAKDAGEKPPRVLRRRVPEGGGGA